MIVIFVHGWSVTDTNTYGLLPEAISEQAHHYGLDVNIKHIWLGKYISFDDTVSVSDIVRAFNQALRDQLPDGDGIAEFSCITHSTGGPVVREWLERYYGSEHLEQSPLRHLIMLAPANHGSPLAALGKQKVGRIKAWFDGIEPGQLVLNWLSLGSQQQIDLSRAYLNYRPAQYRFFPFVLTGQSIDKKFYDFVNSYLNESGSDGVVRVSGANLNYSMVKLVESNQRDKVTHSSDDLDVSLLKLEGDVERPLNVPLGVVTNASHSGKRKGIMRSVISPRSTKPQLAEILQCLTVNTESEYLQRAEELVALTQKTQKNKHRYMNLVFVVKDDQGEPINDYDLILLGGEKFDPDKLTRGFFVDRQQNAANLNHLIYYVNYDLITKSQLTGFRIIARPSEGLSYYNSVEYRIDASDIEQLLRPNETFYFEIVLRRCIDKQVFRFDSAVAPKLRKKGTIFTVETRDDFKKVSPSGEDID